jgi:hypothetical protein
LLETLKSTIFQNILILQKVAIILLGRKIIHRKCSFFPPEKHFQKRTQNSENFAPKKSLSEIGYISFLCVITIWKVKMPCWT